MGAAQDMNGKTGSEMVQGVLVTMWGEVAVIDIEVDEVLQAMQALTADGRLITCVGGVQVGSFTVDFWLDDEGLLKAAPQVNHWASMVSGHQIVGNVLLLTSNDEGESLGVSGEMVRWLRQHLDVQAGSFTVDEALTMAGTWWPSLAQRSEWVAEGVAVPVEVPAPVVIPLTDELFDRWLETGEVSTV